MCSHEEKVNDLCDRIGVGMKVADELLVLSGDDIDMAEEASITSPGLDQCKAKIIDKRFKRLESVRCLMKLVSV